MRTQTDSDANKVIITKSDRPSGPVGIRNRSFEVALLIYSRELYADRFNYERMKTPSSELRARRTIAFLRKKRVLYSDSCCNSVRNISFILCQYKQLYFEVSMQIFILFFFFFAYIAIEYIYISLSKWKVWFTVSGYIIKRCNTNGRCFVVVVRLWRSA